MYVVEFHNLRPNDEVDENIDEHRAFLAKHAAAGVIVAAGPKIPRTGGMIIVDNIPREQLDKLLSEDPFLRRGSARCEVIEFKSNFRCPGLGQS